MRGETHDSVTDFRSGHPRELEADEFSSALLMPNGLFAAELKRRGMKVCTLKDLSRLAETAFRTSLTSTVRHHVGFDWEPCPMVVSEGAVVRWARHSERMQALNMRYIEAGSTVPNTSPTARLWDRLGRERALDQARARIIKRAWETGTTPVEFHSHPGDESELWPAIFSPSDMYGFSDYVPHCGWCLRDRPYLAVVVSPNGFDALVWAGADDEPAALDAIREDRAPPVVPTNRTIASLKTEVPDNGP